MGPPGATNYEGAPFKRPLLEWDENHLVILSSVSGQRVSADARVLYQGTASAVPQNIPSIWALAPEFCHPRSLWRSGRCGGTCCSTGTKKPGCPMSCFCDMGCRNASSSRPSTVPHASLCFRQITKIVSVCAELQRSTHADITLAGAIVFPSKG